MRTLRENYSRLLQGLKRSGVKLSDRQKSDLDTFIVALEHKINESKKITARKTKKLVTENLEEKYEHLVGKILKHLQEHVDMASKIETRKARLNERKKVAHHVSNYLDLYLESVLPKKKIVDYGDWNRMKKTFGVLREALLVDEKSVQKKRLALEKEFEHKNKILKLKDHKLKKELNESIMKARKLNEALKKYKGVQLLEQKIKDLPAYEASKIKMKLLGASVSEINAKFDRVLESVKREKERKIQEAAEGNNVDDEIDKIINSGSEDSEEEEPKKKDTEKVKKSSEDDEEAEEDKESKKETKNESDDSDEDSEKDSEEDSEEDEDSETLNESDVIDSRLMKLWIKKLYN